MLVDSKLSEGDRFVLGPAEKGLLKEGESDHHAFVIGCNKCHQPPPDRHSSPRNDQGPLPVSKQIAEANQKHRAEY